MMREEIEMPNKYASIIEKLQGRYSDDSLLGPTLDEAHLDKIEAQLGHPLPADYREFLRDYAGIWVGHAGFPYLQDGHSFEGSIRYFHGSNEERTLADSYYQTLKNCEFDEEDFPGIYLVREVPNRLMEGSWPKEFLLIGCDGGGRPICLALFGRRPGAIFYWVWDGDIYLVADSFDEFMHLLYSYSD